MFLYRGPLECREGTRGAFNKISFDRRNAVGRPFAPAAGEPPANRSNVTQVHQRQLGF